MTTITRDIAAKVRDIVDVGLVSGLGDPQPGKFCVEAAVCYALGLPHGDDPGCVSPALRALKIRLNDARWSSPQARARGLRRLAVAQLGSAGVLDDRAFRARVVALSIRWAVPIALRAAARLVPDHAPALEAAARRCEQEETIDAARAARTSATAAADAAAYAAAYAAAANAAYAATAAYAADDAAAARTHDRVLAAYAERVVQILIDLNAPGCQWLDLVPVTEEELNGHSL